MKQPLGRLPALFAVLAGVAVAGVLGAVALVRNGAPLPAPPGLSLPIPGLLGDRRAAPAAPAAPALFYDSFDGEVPDPARWRVAGASGVRLLQGDLLLQGLEAPLASPSWGSPGLYSVGAVPARPGRTVVSVARPGLGTVRGPLYLLSPSRFPADPTVGGYGVGFDSLGGDAGNGGTNLRLTAVTPEGQVPYDPEVARPHDYLMATTLRPGGSYHFVSGGAFGAFPEATLIWVGSAGGAAAGDGSGELHVGVDARRTAATTASVAVVDLPGEFATPLGLARGADTFQRADAADLGRTEVGGFAWHRSAGNVRLTGGGIVREGQDEARAVFDPKAADGIFEMTVRLPEGPFASPSLYFRYQDERNWWRFRCNPGSVDLVRSVDGVESVAYQTGSVSCAPGETYRVVVRAHGPSVNVWLNRTGVTYSAGVVVPGETAAATAVGVGFGAGEAEGGASPVVEQVVVWPKTVTLPAAAGPAPSVARSGDRLVVEDTFAGAAPARLQNRRLDTGGPWREYSGTWVAGRGRLVPTAAGAAGGSAEAGPPADPTVAALAAVATGVTDMAATATVELTPPAQAGPEDAWVGGPLVRYTDGKGFIWARLAHRPAGAVLELWESLDGVSRFLGATDVTGQVGAGGRHTIGLAALGQRVAASVDGALVLEAATSVRSGTWAGLLVTDDTLPGAFAAFRATNARPDAVAPPPVVDLGVSAAPPAPPVLTWPPAGDDASGTRFYRVFRSTAAGTLGAQINGDGETTGTTFTDARPPGPGTYCYSVVAVDGAGNAGQPELSQGGQRCVAYAPAP